MYVYTHVCTYMYVYVHAYVHMYTYADATLAENSLADNNLADNSLADNKLSNNTRADNSLADDDLADNNLANKPLTDSNLADNKPDILLESHGNSMSDADQVSLENLWPLFANLSAEGSSLATGLRDAQCSLEARLGNFSADVEKFIDDNQEQKK